MAEAPNKADKVKPSTTELCKLFDNLKIENKSKLKWKGSRQQLQSFVKTLPLAGEWSSGDNFNSNLISIKFSDTRTLRIQGKSGKELEERLLNIASETGETRRSLIKELRDFLRRSEIASATTDEDGNKCNGQCHPIYRTEDGHIKQRVGDERILGSKAQFCAAFYHVHEWEHRQEDQFRTREHYCLDEEDCIIAKEAKKPEKEWSVQARTVVAVVKFKDENEEILYEARYTNCAPTQKHAEDFFEQDIKNGELGEKVQANSNGTITLYLTYQPCNKSTGKTAGTDPNQSCCATLKNIYQSILQKHTISLCVKAANTRRLKVKNKDTKDAKENVDEEIDEDSENEKNEKRRKNAVRGIGRLMRIGVNVGGMTPEDWGYLLSLTEDFEGRHDLDKSVQDIFSQIQVQVNQA